MPVLSRPVLLEVIWKANHEFMTHSLSPICRYRAALTAKKDKREEQSANFFPSMPTCHPIVVLVDTKSGELCNC